MTDIKQEAQELEVVNKLDVWMSDELILKLSDAQAVIDQLRAANGDLQLHFDTLKADYEALKSAPVVMPERRIQALAGVSLFDLGHAKGWNACLDKFESLNRSKT